MIQEHMIGLIVCPKITGRVNIFAAIFDRNVVKDL